MTSRILVVEDNAAISDLLATLLKRNDIDSVCVNTVAEAQALLAEDEDFNLLLSDILIPGPLDGIGLIKWAAEKHPKLRIGLMSGYRTSNDEGVDVPVLSKPFRENDLLAYLHERLK